MGDRALATQVNDMMLREWVPHECLPVRNKTAKARHRGRWVDIQAIEWRFSPFPVLFAVLTPGSDTWRFFDSCDRLCDFTDAVLAAAQEANDIPAAQEANDIPAAQEANDIPAAKAEEEELKLIRAKLQEHLAQQPQ